MSRVGKSPIPLPKGVKVELRGNQVKVEGPKGKLERQVSAAISVKVENNEIVLERRDSSKESNMMHGTERALLNNMVHGVSEGFATELELVGVGYRADMKGNIINLALGYSHPIDFPLPAGVKGAVIKEGRDTFVRVESADKQLLGAVVAQLRGLRKVEPYKGKGVRYRGQVVKLKPGKTSKK